MAHGGKELIIGEICSVSHEGVLSLYKSIIIVESLLALVGFHDARRQLLRPRAKHQDVELQRWILQAVLENRIHLACCLALDDSAGTGMTSYQAQARLRHVSNRRSSAWLTGSLGQLLARRGAAEAGMAEQSKLRAQLHIFGIARHAFEVSERRHIGRRALDRSRLLPQISQMSERFETEARLGKGLRGVPGT